MTLRRAISLFLIWLTVISFLPLTAAPIARAQDPAGTSDEASGLRFRLSEGSEKVETATPSPVVTSEALSEVETQKLLARLPKLQTLPGDEADFRLRDNSLPPPRTGQTIAAAFAPASIGTTPPASSSAPLEVTRSTPEGEVALAPTLSITFSQPMVAVSSQEEAALHVPVTLSPQPSGKWRWLGTQTLLFQPDVEGGRLPMATSYTVSIPAGVKSALGNALRETKTFTFATPPPTLKNSYPSGESQPRDPLIFMEFDQRIDATQVIEKLRIQPDASMRLRTATADEIAADSAVNALVKQAQEGRWLVVRAVGPDGNTKSALPPDTNVRVVILAGTPSAEGPRTTAKDQTLTFKTFGALRVTEKRCGYQERCSPFDSFNFSFSNQLDEEYFKPEQVKISPEIPDVKISQSYNRIEIEGAKLSNTTYTVTLDPIIKDKFGQTLSGETEYTFKVTTADPTLFTTGDGFVVVDPAVRRAFTIYSLNHPRLKVQIYKVTPDDWPQFRRYQAGRSANTNAIPPPGKLVSDKIIEVKAGTDELIETAIDLSPALNEGGYGQVFVKVEPVQLPEDRNKPVTVYAYRQNKVEAWVQSTEIGLDAFADKKELVVWANSLSDGRPLNGVDLRVSVDSIMGTTGADGLARLEFKLGPKTKREGWSSLLVARRGNDVAVLPQTFYSYYYDENESSTWQRSDSTTTLSWYVIDDRKMYRPGEEVNVKGWIRKIDLTPRGGTEMFTAAGETVNYVVKDSQGNEITKGSLKLNALAGFNLKIKLPATMNLGPATLSFKLEKNDEAHSHYFQVQEFRRPEFEITARASEAPHFVGSFASITMTAGYYSGGGLAATDVAWEVTSGPTNYTPPNRDDYTFGKFYAWWREEADESEESEQTFKGRTDSEGKHTLRIDFDGVNPPRPSSVVAEARVQDVNRQTIAATTALLVHPSDVYVGLKSARSFVQKGEQFDIATIVTDLDGKALGGREVRLRLVRLEGIYAKGEWKLEERDQQEQVLTSGADAVSARFQTKEGGMYRLTARVRDDRERLNESELSLWVAGGKLPPQREVEQEEVELIPGRKNYSANDVAEILVQSPFAPAEGVLTIRRSGLLRTERFTMPENSYTLRIPIEEAMTPNVYVQVDLVGAAVRVDDEGNALVSLPKRPAFASGEIKLDIPPATRRLTVKATPRETALEPGGETVVDVEVKDANGRGVGGTDTAVIVVDESVLALTDYKLDDPLTVFYPERDEDVSDYHLRERVKLANPEAVGQGSGELPPPPNAPPAATIMALPINGRDAKGFMVEQQSVNVTASSYSTATTPSKIAVRQNFNALAVFAASLPTDANGRAQVRVKLPDNLTRYRVMAISVAGGKFAGSGESAITARKQLMARPSAPRFLNYGDTAELPVVLQNQTDQAMSVNVAVRASNVQLTEGAGRRVTVPANDRVEVRFPIFAVKPGILRFQIAASSGVRIDAAEGSLPVYTPATTEAFATYGVIDTGSIAQPVKAPADAVKTFGGLEITTASTQLQELTDAVIYLFNYPYGCAEQIASRVIGIAALKDVLTAFKTKDLPSPQAMRDAVNADLKVLHGLQNDDGGFGFWSRGDASFPYVSVHVAHALVRAQSKDFAVPANMLTNSQNYLRTIEQKIPDSYTFESRRAIQAYALYVRFLMNDRDAAKARKLVSDSGGVDKLPLESLGWLLPVLSGDPGSVREVEMIRRHLNNRVTETAGAAHFADSYRDGAFTVLHSNRRTDGVILEALIGDQPQSTIIPKLVRGLLSGRTRGRWTNTQENVFILLALDRYFSTYEAATPDFVARVWLGNGYAGQQIFKGRSVDRQRLNLPMQLLVERTAAAPANLTIAKEGEGRLYFRIGTKYAPANLKLAAADYGFMVERKYEAIDDPADVRLEPDGTWSIRAGARVRVRLAISNPARRYHVALVDPLPAGLEALNPELATTEKLPQGSTGSGINRRAGGIFDHYSYWRGTWYDHQNLRDERVEAFSSLLWEGVHEYTYFARATTPGLFVVPPAKAEEMYSPETFGRGKSDRVRVR